MKCRPGPLCPCRSPAPASAPGQFSGAVWACQRVNGGFSVSWPPHSDGPSAPIVVRKSIAEGGANACSVRDVARFHVAPHSSSVVGVLPALSRAWLQLTDALMASARPERRRKLGVYRVIGGKPHAHADPRDVPGVRQRASTARSGTTASSGVPASAPPGRRNTEARIPSARPLARIVAPRASQQPRTGGAARPRTVARLRAEPMSSLTPVVADDRVPGAHVREKGRRATRPMQSAPSHALSQHLREPRPASGAYRLCVVAPDAAGAYAHARMSIGTKPKKPRRTARGNQLVKRRIKNELRPLLCLVVTVCMIINTPND